MEATKYCAKCKKQVYSENYMIHQAMCRGPREGELFRSRVISPQQEIWDQPQNQVQPPNCNNNTSTTDQNPFRRMKSDGPRVQPQQQPNQFVPVMNTNQREQTMLQQPGRSNVNSNYGIANQFVPNVQNQRTNQRQPIVQQQKIPCPNCGYRMSFLELDTHPTQCKVKSEKCSYCNNEFPTALIRDHNRVCPSRPREQTQNRRGISQQPSRRPSLSRRGSNRQTVEHYHYMDQQTGQQMCARVTQDENGNRFTDTHVVQNSERNNPFGNMGSFSPLLNTLFGGIFGGMGNMNIQMGGNNGSNRINFMSSGGQNSFQQMIMNLMNSMNVRPENKVPLDKQLLKKLPIVVFDKNNPDHKSSASCTVCMTDFENGDQLILLPCGHLFNKQCIVPWLKESSLCPNCRQPIKASTKPSHSDNYQQNQRQPQNQSQNQMQQTQMNQTRTQIPNPQNSTQNYNRTNSNQNSNQAQISSLIQNQQPFSQQQNTRTGTNQSNIRANTFNPNPYGR